ncbi:aldo/keto reductase [Planococcus halotolerans]|uniref:Aldo/keto reductase n=1 Tax=Planococcus halotolerans TaxID=2233542 RepID=A0A365L7T4_9BACL|nr:aldo/keto reductase [Planococcus halotolerans]RAZ81460.1 aldo/keto reductase [Planococcus halotolerans]
MKNLASASTLHNAVEMPWFGLGVSGLKDGDETANCVRTAIVNGYRSIDTAAMYGNETGVGRGVREALRETGLSRDDVFITSKVWNSDLGYDSALAAYEASLERLGLDYLDLYLVHWPVEGKYKDTWRALEKLYKDGRVRAIGVCNFQIHHLENVLKDVDIVPMVNQVEYHPLLTQEELHQFCKARNIQLEAWSPLMQGKLLDHPVLEEIAMKTEKTPAQVILRWDLQNGVITIPKSSKEPRIIQNAKIFDFELTDEDMERISALNENRRVGPDPDDFDF